MWLLLSFNKIWTYFILIFIYLTHFWSMFPICTLWKQEKTFGLKYLFENIDIGSNFVKVISKHIK